MNETSIEWVKNPDGTQGYTWNPVTGCLNNCPYCYARKLANGRLMSRYLAGGIVAEEGENHENLFDPFYPRLWECKILEPRDSSRGKGIFVCDMSDLFGIGVPEEWTKRVLKEIPICHDNRFYLLTKQPQNLIKWSPFPNNCWVGVTATDDMLMWKALICLQGIEAKVKFISFEPLLKWENPFIIDRLAINLKIVQWVIIGAQTKPYKPPKIEWVREIVEACDKAGIPVFLKDNLKPLLFPNLELPQWARTPHSLTKLRQEMPS